jgi:hypothetical protein
VRCRGRVPQAWEMAQNGKQRGPCFLSEAQSSLKFYALGRFKYGQRRKR